MSNRIDQMGRRAEKSQDDSGEQVDGHDSHQRNHIDRELGRAELPNVLNGFEIYQPVAGVDQDGGQRRKRYVAKQVREKEEEESDPNAVQNGTHPARSTGFHVRRASHDHSGDRQQTQRSADRVSRTLSYHFSVVIRFVAVVHPIDGGRGQQSLGGGYESEGQNGAQHRRRQKTHQKTRANHR